MKILMMGQTIVNGNLGCVALTYSAFQFFEEINRREGLNIEYVLLDEGVNEAKTRKFCDALNIDANRVNVVVIGNVLKSFKDRKILKDIVRKCDIVFDLTLGDSFSDIYGMKRFLRMGLQKYIVYKNGVKLILGNQTYGPYKHWVSKKIAKYLIDKSNLCISRDELSINYLRQIACKKEVYRGTDLAFLLPYSQPNRISGEKRKIGINLSGLLWEDVNNSLQLKIDYKEYIEELAEYLKASGDSYEVYMISHVLGTEEVADNDVRISNIIAEKYNFSISPLFTSPIEAKSFISSMDVLIGSRMHATIAAVSTGVATIPVAYSRKFAGVFNNIGYNYIIDGQKVNTDTAIQKTIEYIDNYLELEKDAVQAKMNASKYFEEEMNEIVKCFNS